MTPDVLGPLVGMAAVIGFFVVVGMNIRRLRMRETPGGENFERLADAVDGLHEEVRMLREEYTELHERMDFAERMLATGKPGKALGEQASTPS